METENTNLSILPSLFNIHSHQYARKPVELRSDVVRFEQLLDIWVVLFCQLVVRRGFAVQFN